MKQTRKKIRRTLTAWSILLLIVLLLLLLGWRGVIWFNMPSKRRYPVRGVDVSHYQGTVDWECLSAQGVTFAFIKATEGSGTTDECFAANWQGARAAGIFTGAYHFFSFDSSAQTQADNFIAAVPAEPDAMPPVIDLEYYRTENLPDAETVKQNISVLLERLRSHYGKTPVIYTTKGCWDAYLQDLDGGDYLLWMRSILTAPAGETAPLWTFWQYNPRGRLDGYTGGTDLIDLNVYRGNLESFLTEFGYDAAEPAASQKGG